MKRKRDTAASASEPAGSVPVALFLGAVQKRLALRTLQDTLTGQLTPQLDDVHEETLVCISDLAPLEAHDIVTAGLPMALALEMTRLYAIIERETLFRLLGVSERVLRHGKNAEKNLDTDSSDRLIRLASVTEQAFNTLGSQVAAERWLVAPAIELDWRRPIDLLHTSAGTDLVRTVLTRIDHCICV